MLVQTWVYTKLNPVSMFGSKWQVVRRKNITFISRAESVAGGVRDSG
jgi:hypothetical protein